MRLDDITEIGFYKEVDGEDIWECFENTDRDEEWRKDFPLLLAQDTSIAYRLLLTLNKRLNNMLDHVEKENKRFVYNYRKNSTYTAIQNLNQKGFETIAAENGDYVWTLLKYLSTSLNEMNNIYLNYINN